MSDEAKERKRVRFHYLKAPQFMTIHVDGAIGGLTPSGGIHLALYSERAAIPQETEFFIDESGKLGDPVPDGEVTRGGIVREMQCDAILNKATAHRLREWLEDQITKLEAIEKKKKA